MLAIALTIFPGYASALISNADLGDISVTVEDATRTKPVFVESLVKKCLERGEYKTWDSLDPESMEQCLSNSRLFSSVRVQVNKPEITVKISDRWTLIPIPYFYESDGKRAAGAFIYESNFLGHGKIVSVGGSLATEGNTFSMMYMDPAVHFTDYTFRMFAFRSSTESEAYHEETIIYGFHKKDKSFSLSPGYRITPSLDVSFSLSYSGKEYNQAEYFVVPADYEAWGLGAGISYSKSDYKLFYNDGLSARINGYGQVDRSDNEAKISSVTARFGWDVLLFEKHALQLGLHADYQSKATVGDVNAYGQRKGYRGIQTNGLWTSRIVSTSVDYQIPIAKWSHGTITVAPFMDFGVFKPYFEGTGDNYLAYGVGAYYFMNLVNIPGMGLTFGVNEEFMGTYVSFQIGMGFH